MILLLFASGGSTSSALTGKPTSMICSSNCRRAILITNATRGVLIGVDGLT
jgi:hypothetical protein